jgi:hypothetical protein
LYNIHIYIYINIYIYIHTIQGAGPEGIPTCNKKALQRTCHSGVEVIEFLSTYDSIGMPGLASQGELGAAPVIGLF